MDKKKFIIAQLIWLVGLPTSFAVTFLLREYFALGGLGMPEEVWFFIHFLLFSSSLLFAYKSVKRTSVLKKILITSAFVTLNGIYYIILTWPYVIGSGIDAT